MACALVDIFIKFFPRFRSILKRGDAFGEEFYKENIVREGVYFNPQEGKKNYTFLNLDEKVDPWKFEYGSIEDLYAAITKRDIERQNRFED